MSISDAVCGRHRLTTAAPPGRRATVWLVVGLWLFGLGGCSSGSGGLTRVEPGTTRATIGPEQAAGLYGDLCADCHGPQGRADTPLAEELPLPPGDLTRCSYKYRSTPSGTLPTDCDLLRTLTVGIPGARMPDFGALLSTADLRGLVRHIKGMCGSFYKEKQGVSLNIPRPGLSDRASTRRGHRLFDQQGCPACHGVSGRGDGAAVATLRDDLGRPAVPRDLTRGVFRGGFERADIYRAFSTGLDGTPMPMITDEVGAAQRWDLTHFIVSLASDRGKVRRYLEQPPRWYEPSQAWQDLLRNPGKKQ